MLRTGSESWRAYCALLDGESAGRTASRCLIRDLASGASVGSRLRSARVIGSSAARSNATVSMTGLLVSRSISPAVPRLLLECMAHGTPAIVSDIPPHREILGPVDGYGLFVRPGDVLQLQARLGQVLQDKEHHLQIARRAQSYVRASYSWQRSAEATESLYYAAASRSRLRALGRVERKLAAPEAR